MNIGKEIQRDPKEYFLELVGRTDEKSDFTELGRMLVELSLNNILKWLQAAEDKKPGSASKIIHTASFYPLLQGVVALLDRDDKAFLLTATESPESSLSAPGQIENFFKK